MWELTHGTGKRGTAAGDPAAPDTGGPADGGAPAAGPTGSGWVIQVKGHHFHNEDRHGTEQDEQFLRATLIHNLDGQGPGVTPAAGTGSGAAPVPVAALGIAFPVIVQSDLPVKKVRVSPSSDRGGAGTSPGGAGGTPPAASAEPAVELKRYDFIVQFCWRPGVDVRPAEPPAAAAPPAP